MQNPTEKFNTMKGDFRSTMRHTMNMISGKDISNYTLLFLDATSKHPAGSHETIFNPNVLLGRGDNCQVKYDDRYKTVSREHACITVSGNRYYLFHNPNAKNPTYVNGNRIDDSYELQNGDEIKLSLDGPRIRFNFSTVKSSTMGLTSRIGLALNQATRPYKRALILSVIFLVAAMGFGGYNLWQNNKLKLQSAKSEKQIEQIYQEKQQLLNEMKKLEESGQVNSEEMTRLRQRLSRNQQQLEAVKKASETPNVVYVDKSDDGNENVNNNDQNTQSPSYQTKTDGINRADKADNENVNFEDLPKSDVYYIYATKVEVVLNGVVKQYRAKDWFSDDRQGIWSGTAFLTDENNLITARHVIQPWRFWNVDEIWLQALSEAETKGGSIEVTFEALSTEGNKFTFSSKNAEFDDSTDELLSIGSGSQKKKSKKVLVKRYQNLSSDWTYINMKNRRGQIKLNVDLASKLKAGAKLYALGYVYGLDTQDEGFFREKGIIKYDDIKPHQAEMVVSKDGLTKGLIHVSNHGYGPGTSGGPVFINNNGKFEVIGIVSSSMQGSTVGLIVPVSNIR